MTILRWYRAENHFHQLAQFVRLTAASADHTIQCLDLFGASGRVAQTWTDAGYGAMGFDIKLSNEHDLTQETGVKKLLTMAMQFLALNIFHVSLQCTNIYTLKIF